MDETTLSVFVDESGRFQHPDPSSRFYIVGMVFHDQRVDVSKLIEDFDRSIAELGLDREAFVFHAGPLIGSRGTDPSGGVRVEGFGTAVLLMVDPSVRRLRVRLPVGLTVS